MAKNGRNWGWKLCSAGLLAMGGAIASLGNCALAQITPDGTLPNNSIVTPQGNSNRISGGTQAGSNLFHSFEQFSVPTGGAAYFNNALDIQNIISRVTGGEISNIDGLLRANGTANLFLLNPNGILFGPNAALNIGGSFVGSTANAVNFADGRQFSATAGQTTPLLTVSVPLGLQYGSNAGRVQVQESGLQVRTGQTLALVGGDVSVEGGESGFLSASGGRIELGGVAGAGIVEIEGQQSDGGFGLTQLRFPDSVERADVLLTNLADVNVAASGDGSIAINARNIDISGSSRLRGGLETNSGFLGATAGDIRLNATGAINIANGFIFNNVRTGAVGNGGNIDITAGSLSVANGARLHALTLGQGNAGNVTISARDTVSFDGVGSNGLSSAAASTVESGAVGKGGDINITTGSLSLTNGAQLIASTYGQGDAGSVTISASDTVSFDGVGSNELSSAAASAVESGAVGKGGGINITTGSLSMTNGAQLVASTRGQGDAGSVTISASDTVSFDGLNSNGDPSGAFSNVGQQAVGKGGEVNVRAGSLSLTNGAQLGASTLGQGEAGNVTISARDAITLDGEGRNRLSSGVFSTVESGAVGKGGGINITTGSLSLTNGAQLGAFTLGQGDAGSVKINVSNAIILVGTGRDGASSGVFSGVGQEAVGKGGDVNITTGSLSLTNGAQLSTNTRGEGDAGSVTITARDTVSFDEVESNGNPSGAFSIVQSAAIGKGGEISVTAGSLSVTSGAQLSASTFGQGDAGSVTIQARDTISFDGVNINGNSGAFSAVAPGATGKGGDVNITTGSLSMTNGAQLVASTFGQGDAGSVTMSARDAVSFNGANSNGDPSGAFSSVGHRAMGKGGEVNVTAESLSLTNGAELLTTTLGQGDAGSVTITAHDTVSLDGVDRAGFSSGLGSNVEPGAVGNGGGINIKTESLAVTNGAQLSASSEGSGAAGNIEVSASSIRLDNEALLSSNTRAGQGNIILRSQDLVLHSGSNITTNATGSTVIGGNITIDTDVLAALENSDISANSADFRGGQVKINAQGIFGTKFRDAPTLESDITATGGSPDLSGTVEINTPDVDPSQGLVALPAELVDASVLIASSRCGVGRRQDESKFVVTGRGGLPLRPGDAPPSPYPTGTVRSILSSGPSTETQRSSVSVSDPSTNATGVSAPTQIVEAQGWVINDKGEVVLTANAPNATLYVPWLPATDCHTSHNPS